MEDDPGSRQWVHHVIDLLHAAIHQLHHHDEAARSTLLKATSLLRKEIDPQTSAGTADGRGRLPAWKARKVREYIDSHITDRVLAADLAALVRLSETHFGRSFKRTFGLSPHAFVMQRRLELATQYMLQTDASLSDIALRCGFTDQAHLSNHFRQATGETPAAWRRVRWIPT
jgi:AraC-like DNA-binding protein